MRQQLFASTRFAEQQHGATGLGGAPCLALDLGRGRARPHKTGKRVLGTALAAARHGKGAVALTVKLASRVVQITLQQRKLADQRLQRGLGMVKQHDADGANHPLGVIAQGDAADYKRARFVGQQVYEHRLAGIQHPTHLRVGNDLLDHAADKLVERGEAQVRQEPLVALVHPHNAPAFVDQEHALADTGKQLEHGARCQRQNALGIQGQRGSVIGGKGHGSMLARVHRGTFALTSMANAYRHDIGLLPLRTLAPPCSKEDETHPAHLRKPISSSVHQQARAHTSTYLGTPRHAPEACAIATGKRP